MKLGEIIKSDLARYEQTFALRGQRYSKSKVFWESFLFKAGFQAVFLYRLSRWFYEKRCIYIAWFFSRLNVTLTGAEIEFNAEIGPGLFIAHPAGIVVGRGTRIGRNATFFQRVSFGVKSWHPDEIRRFPQAGDGCYFFAGSSVFGGTVIGNDCVVAAHAVVTKDMPEGSLAKGVPARIIPDEGKKMICSWTEPQKAS